jgi:hypothetical protein
MAVAAAVTLIVVLRKHAPPEPARLLPGADGYVYINFQWMRRTDIIGQLPPVPHEPEYEQFIQATGFQFERDLNQAALAIHYPDQSSSAREPRFSEVFVGKFQGDRLSAYLRTLAASVESYRSADIYNIPLEGRTVRVAILGVDSVAASNVDDPQVIRGIIDHSRKLASPFGGPALLRHYYGHVPLASLGWAIARIDPRSNFFAGGSAAWSSILSQPAVLLASIRYLRTLNLRAVAFAGSANDAKAIADRATTFLNLMHAAEASTGAEVPDPDIKALFDSLQVEQQTDRAVMTANVPLGIIRKVLAEAPERVAPEPPAVEKAGPSEKKAPKGKK